MIYSEYKGVKAHDTSSVVYVTELPEGGRKGKDGAPYCELVSPISRLLFSKFL
jgi:hypothetical protein